MKIHVLIENTSRRGDLLSEHGLSLLVEACGCRVLFDTGATGAFTANAEKMNIDLQTVDFCVLSHGHYDHGGGIDSFLQWNTHAPVWVSPHAFDPHFNAKGKNIGIPRPSSERIRVTDSSIHQLAPGIVIHRAPDMPSTYPDEGQGMTAIVDDSRVKDDFRHEQYLLIEENGLRVLISGCSHRGVLNIATYFQPHVMVGGFHLMNCDAISDAPRLRDCAAHLLRLPATYYTGHCTGAAAMSILKPLMADRLYEFSTGEVICIG